MEFHNADRYRDPRTCSICGRDGHNAKSHALVVDAEQRFVAVYGRLPVSEEELVVWALASRRLVR